MTDNITKVAQLHNERDDTWDNVFEADAVGGDRVRVEASRDICEPGVLRKHLLKKGADISHLDHSRGHLNAAIEADAQVIHRAASLGWHGDDHCFVGPGYVVGGEGDAIVPPLANRWTINIDQRGTLAEWQKLIDCARFSTAMILSVSASFAAPLMRPLNCQNFGLVLNGPSRCAKSTCQLMGASVFGFGTEDHLPTPKGTAAGLIETASYFNDHVFTLNELGAAAGGIDEKHTAVLEMTYAFSGGQDVIRHSTWGGPVRSDFKTLVLMSSEASPDEWAARAGKGRQPGETARLIGAPVLHDGRKTVFDTFPEMPIGERGGWIRDQFSRLRNGLPNQRGVAFKVFLEKLTADRVSFVKNAEEDAAAFRTALEKHAKTPIARDIIFKFGVIYAGARAAIDARVLLFDDDTIFDAIRRSCIAALGALPNAEADLASDLLKLKGVLEDAGMIDADEASNRQKRNMDQAEGYYEKESPGVRYTVRAVTLMASFPSLLRARRVIEWLDGEGFLRHQRERKTGVSTEWAQTQPKWPSGQRVRSFVLYFPGGLDVLDLDA